MKTSNRREFLKKVALTGASAWVAPGLLATEAMESTSFASIQKSDVDQLIIPKENGLKITGTFWMKYHMIFLIKIGAKKNGIKISST